ncbi:NADH-quinone oxidoreductase subunit M [Candidatus Annandia adelgestsuga]|uniref:NADH-quinone oxidoreductase subunit M n=1 Tax=Candidatus Annandia adelgestsuga TaxID=1302411 RepID=A0A3S5HNX5_9ENTR|nr:NADH-quinone oxidoreductase subunit M [Candidatus Annandia adelgestsuga]AZP36319.1 NADH-quinone oxidoreductase subunit M [Candidatus Annandia adelgestsuga]
MILVLLLSIPFLGGLICWQISYFNLIFARFISLLSMIIVTYISSKLFLDLYNKNFLPNEWESEFSIPWITKLGIDFHLAADNLSILMILTTSILSIISILCSWKIIKKYRGLFLLNLLWIIGCSFGIFLSADMFLFFIFWEMILFPIYFMIIKWGNYYSKKNVNFITNKFFIYSQLSSLLMLVSIIILVLLHYDQTCDLTFNYNLLLKTDMNCLQEYLIMLGFFIACLVKMPIVPFHGWLSQIHKNTPVSGSIDLIGIIVKTSVYVIIRFCIPFCPNVTIHCGNIIRYIGIFTIIYSSLMSFRQKNIKKFIAYISISHMGLILIAAYTRSMIVYHGLIIQLISISFSTSALFIIFEQIYDRIYTSNTKKMYGLWNNINYIPGFCLFFLMANLGIPGTGNFIGEFLILMGIFQFYPIISFICSLSLILTTIYSLFIMHRVFYGLNKNRRLLKTMSIKEFFILILLVILLLFLGVYPQFILDTNHISLYNSQYYI